MTNDTAEEDDPRLKIIFPTLSRIRCASHTVALAVSDTLKEVQIKKHLKLIKMFVKTLRKMPYKNAFKLSSKSKPKLSCDTRWNSEYDMAVSLRNEKEFIIGITKNDKDVALKEEIWKFIEDFVEGFQPVAQLTLSLQSSQITLGDFYLLWVRCKLMLKRNPNPIVSILQRKMVDREAALIKNKAFLSAIYVDQRINYRNSPLMTDEQRAEALVIIFIINLYLDN